MNPGNAKNRGPDWRLQFYEIALAKVLEQFKQNKRFDENLVSMFDRLARSCMLLWDRKKAVHFFFNYNPTYHEIHYRVIPPKIPGPDDENCSYKLYDKLKPNDSDSQEEKESKKDEFHKLVELVRGFGIEDCPGQASEQPLSIHKITGEDKEKLSSIRHIKEMNISLDLEKDPDDPITLVMDWEHPYRQNKKKDRIYCNLGCLLLYGGSRGRKQQKSAPLGDKEADRLIVENWRKSIADFFKRHVNAMAKTYLPSYLKARSTRAAILIGDITNFTQLLGLLRIAQKTPENYEKNCRKLLQEHYKEISEIVHYFKGSIERFTGDGLMAVFGQHEEHPAIALGNAVAVASKIVTNFRKRREKIEEQLLRSGKNELNEMVELDYSVGINYGTVFFEYLGDEEHLEYSCIGDHVAFARRLMSKAARFDVATNSKWPPILISQTAELHLREFKGILKKNEFFTKHVLHVKGYGYPSYVYGLESDQFDIENYKQLIDDLWKDKKTEEKVVEELKKG